MTPDELCVYELIEKSENKITQLQIARSEPWLGSHPRYESHLSIDYEQSTLRRVRQIVRSLRVKRGLLIISDVNGYWIMKDKQEAIEYCERTERMAKAWLRAALETYAVMKKNYDIKSDYFEQSQKLIADDKDIKDIIGDGKYDSKMVQGTLFK